MFSWVELLLAKTLTSVAAKPIAATMTRTASAPRAMSLACWRRPGTLTIIPGALVIFFVRNYIAKGFALGRVCIVAAIASMGIWEYFSPGGAPRRGVFAIDTTRGDRLFLSLLGSAFIFMAWLYVFGAPLWWPLGICAVWAVFVFRYV
jgi:predicted small integral membrane protein